LLLRYHKISITSATFQEIYIALTSKKYLKPCADEAFVKVHLPRL